MARYTAEFDETFQVSASPEDVLRQFLDLDQVIEHYGDLDSAEYLDENTLRFLLTNQNHGVFSFQGHYDCRYLPDGDDAVVWESVGEGGNIVTKGRATVTESLGGCTLHYVAEMTLDIEVNKMLAPLLKPVVEASIPHEMKGYIKRMIKAVE
jgi:carbon monoxide dehydrogenase subunit G